MTPNACMSVALLVCTALAAFGNAHGARQLQQGLNYAALLSRIPASSGVSIVDSNGNVVRAGGGTIPAAAQPATRPVVVPQGPVPQPVAVPRVQPAAVPVRQQAGPVPQQQPAVAPAASSGNAILDLHNTLRARHHAPPLAWDTSLVNSAQAWANNLANSCSFYHSGPGENMASGYNNWNDVIMAFYNEIYSYNFNAPGYSSATGHATQLLWVSSKQLGCATAQRAGCWENIIFVCHYYPVGNVNSPAYFQANVLPQ